jgi:hypothetical protein
LKTDRFKYDQEDSDEEPTYDTDAYSIQIMQHRAITMAKAREQAAVAAQAHAQAQAQAAQQRRLQADQAGNAPAANPVPRHHERALVCSPALLFRFFVLFSRFQHLAGVLVWVACL